MERRDEQKKLLNVCSCYTGSCVQTSSPWPSNGGWLFGTDLWLLGFFELVVANAQHLKAVPGRKTNVKDAEWIADLLQHGLLAPSLVPARDQQELREFTRLRLSLIQERSRLVNRIHKLLQQAGIKLELAQSC